MIKYDTKTGSSFLNTKARDQRDGVYKLSLRGMNCKKCNSDTLIKFTQSGDSYVKGEIDACCLAFEQRIREKLLPNKNN